MPKADPKHDYYADVECKPTADAAEIKRAFKRLAFKYHPDRNHGNEEEAGHKFQEIQSAYEILTDPEKRAKYDADRWRHSLQAGRSDGPVPSPPRTPFNVNTGFPPPPRRNQPGQNVPPKPGAAPTAKNPSTGASRYAGIPRTFAQSRENQDKAQAYSAWEHMKHRGNQTGPPPPPRRPPRPTSYAAPNSKSRGGWDEPMPPPPKPGGQQADPFVERPNGMPNAPNINRPGAGPHPSKSPKHPTFFYAPEMGDETQFNRQQAAYYNIPRGSRPAQVPRPQSQYIPPTQGPPPGFRHVNPNATGFKMPASDDSFGDRIKTPYASKSGEKTYLNSESLNRSASTASNLHTSWKTSQSRETSKSRNNTRHRSASPSMRSSNLPEDYSSSSTSDSSDEEVTNREKLRPKSQYPRRASADDRHGPRVATETYTYAKHPEVTVEVDDDNSSRQRKAGDYHPSSRRPSAGNGQNGAHYQETKWSPERNPASATHLNTQHRNGQSVSDPIEKSREWQEKYGAAQNSRHFDRPAAAEPKKKSPKYDKYPAFPSADHPFQTPQNFSSLLREPLEKRPSWPYWAIPSIISPTSVTEKQKSQCTPVDCKSVSDLKFVRINNDNDTNERRTSFFIPNESSSSESSAKNSSSENVTSRFSPSAWKDKFNDPSSYFPPPTTTMERPRRGRSPTKSRSAATTSTTKASENKIDPQVNPADQSNSHFGGPGAVQDPTPPNFSEEQWAQHFKESSWAYPPPSAQAGKGKTKTPRKMSINKKPSIPKGPTVSSPSYEGFAENVTGGINNHRTASAQSIHSNGSPMDIDPKAPPGNEDTQPMEMKNDPIANIIRSAVPPTSKDEFDDASIDFEELKKTEPLSMSSQGLQGMGDLAAVLPFESQASVDPSRLYGPLPRELPPVPLPPPGPSSPNLTRGAWEHYVSQFDNYLLEWNIYNQRMLNHFQARQNQLPQLPSRWTAVPSDEGLMRYLSGIEEDFRVREHWDKSWSGHRENMAGFAKIRARAAKVDLLE